MRSIIIITFFSSIKYFNTYSKIYIYHYLVTNTLFGWSSSSCFRLELLQLAAAVQQPSCLVPAGHCSSWSQLLPSWVGSRTAGASQNQPAAVFCPAEQSDYISFCITPPYLFDIWPPYLFDIYIMLNYVFLNW